MEETWNARLYLLLLLYMLPLLTSCGPQEQKPLLVYAGKGLKPIIDEAIPAFEQRHGIPVTVIYAGSENLLATIGKTLAGDIFIPGSAPYIIAAENILTYKRELAEHIPAFAVRTDSSKQLETFSDLLADGVRIAVGNKDMCAIGGLAVEIFETSERPAALWNNVVVTASTVNELLALVSEGEVDAAMIWADMLSWPEAEGLKLVKIPDSINRSETIHAAVLAYSKAPNQAALFVDFLSTEGKSIFARFGYGQSR